MRSAVPAVWAGVVAVTLVGELTVMPVAWMPARVTLVVPVRLVPVMVMVVPPVVGPVVGVIVVIVGAAGAGVPRGALRAVAGRPAQ